MRVHVTDQLFGLEAFSRPLEPASDMVAEPGPAEVSSPLTQEVVESEDRTAPFSAALPVEAVRRLVSRKLVLGLLVFLLAATVGLSMFTLVMKTRKKAASYELAHQTRLFRRMSKHRAIYELEYAFLRTNSPILEEFTRQGWREITPQDLTYVPIRKPEASASGGSNPVRTGGLTW